MSLPVPIDRLREEMGRFGPAFLLTVTDGIGATGTDTLVVTVNPGGGDNCPWHAAGGCVADFNNSGGTPDDADIATFFSLWNNGGC